MITQGTHEHEKNTKVQEILAEGLYQYLLPISQSRFGSSSTQFGPLSLPAFPRTVRRASTGVFLKAVTREVDRRNTFWEHTAVLQLIRSIIALAMLNGH